MLIPLVELDNSWTKEPCKSLKTAKNDHKAETKAEVSANVAPRFLSATDDEGKKGPESEDPGEWDDPGDGSVVDLLEDALVSMLNVG